MTPSRNFEENALKIQKKPRKSLQIHKTLLPLQSPNKKARSRDRAGYLREQIRKGEKVATSPTRGTGGGNILRYGVMVALQILALSVRVRVLLSQPRQTKVSDRD